MSKRTILIFLGVVLALLGAVLFWQSFSKRSEAEVVISAGVSGLYGIHNGKLYYRVGNSLLTKDIKNKDITSLSKQVDSATMSPTNTELFYNEISNYVINGFRLDLETNNSTDFKAIENSIWCNQDLYLVYTQERGDYTIKDSKGTTRFENVPTSDIYCLDSDLVYVNSDLTQAEEGGTLILKYLSKSKPSAGINIEQQNSPLLQNANKLSFLDSEGSLVLIDKSGSSKLPLRTANAITTQYSSGEMYIVDSPSTEETGVDIHRVDLLSKNFAKVASFATADNVNQNKADIETNVAFEYEDYLYFMVGNSIVRVEL